MKKNLKLLLLVLSFFSLTACSTVKTDMKKIRDIEFTVVDKEEIPQELLERIEEEKGGQMKLGYGDKGFLYAVRGYGMKENTGYSVEVTKCYEGENSVCVETSLLGPEKEEKILKKNTYPYVVIKMEYTDKQLVFD